MTKETKQPVSVRLPERVKSWIRVKAKTNRRSMSAEFLLIIEKAMEKEQKDVVT